MRKVLIAILSVFCLYSCKKGEELPPLEIVFPYPDNTAQADPLLLARNREGVEVWNGGYGSSIVRFPGEEGSFLMLTDRGPVVQGFLPTEKVFVAKRFVPHIAKFKFQGDSLRIVSRVELKINGANARGVFNPEGTESTSMTAVDTVGNVVEPDVTGIDPEGLTIAPDATFWVSDEYGPFLMNFGLSGALLTKLSPYSKDTAGRSLPKVLAKRRPGRGLSGVTITPDGKHLVAIMQSPLNNPDVSSTSSSRICRILMFNMETAVVSEYLYPLENTTTSLTEIKAINNSSFLVIESDDKFPGNSINPSLIKRVYKIDLANASNVTDPDDSLTGKLINGETIEQLSAAELALAGIKTVSKTLLVDLLEALPQYPHNKPEGLVIISNTKIAIINDDDYGITEPATPNREYITKILPLSELPDRTRLYFIDLPK